MSKRPVKIQKIRDGVEDLVLRWFQDENRPATTQGVVDAAVASPSQLPEGAGRTGRVQSLLVKEIKKAKFYYLDQTTYLDRIQGKLGNCRAARQQQPTALQRHQSSDAPAVATEGWNLLLTNQTNSKTTTMKC